MTIPPALNHTVLRAQGAMEEHPDHILLPVYRQAVYRAFVSGDESRGGHARGRLAVLTARHVLTIWQCEQPDDMMPEALLATADGAMAGQIEAERVDAALEEAWEWLSSLKTERWGNPDAYNAGAAAVFAVQETRGEGFLEGVRIGEDDPDDEFFEPGIGDTALFAAAAFAGPSWDGTPDPIKAHEFWIWWLREAIPTALGIEWVCFK
jgi:hypothetical protein